MKKFRLITRNYNHDVNVKYGVYINSKQNSLSLINNDGSPFATVSRSVKGLTEIGKKHVLLKNTDECQGFLEQLIKAGVVKDSGIKVRSGYYNLHLCEIIDPKFKRRL